MSGSSKKINRVSGIGAVLIFIYTISYFLLMVRNVPAVDEQGNVAFKSSFRWAHSAGIKTVSIAVPKTSCLNYVFYPIDKIFYAIAPTSWSLNKFPF